jgi:hypothetical protein
MMTNGSLTPKWKENDTQAQIKQDIAIWAQNEHVKDSTHKWGSTKHFLKN